MKLFHSMKVFISLLLILIMTITTMGLGMTQSKAVVAEAVLAKVSYGVLLKILAALGVTVAGTYVGYTAYELVSQVKAQVQADDWAEIERAAFYVIENKTPNNNKGWKFPSDMMARIQGILTTLLLVGEQKLSYAVSIPIGMARLYFRTTKIDHLFTSFQPNKTNIVFTVLGEDVAHVGTYFPETRFQEPYRFVGVKWTAGRYPTASGWLWFTYDYTMDNNYSKKDLASRTLSSKSAALYAQINPTNSIDTTQTVDLHYNRSKELKLTGYDYVFRMNVEDSKVRVYSDINNNYAFDADIDRTIRLVDAGNTNYLVLPYSNWLRVWDDGRIEVAWSYYLRGYPQEMGAKSMEISAEIETELGFPLPMSDDIYVGDTGEGDLSYTPVEEISDAVYLPSEELTLEDQGLETKDDVIVDNSNDIITPPNTELGVLQSMWQWFHDFWNKLYNTIVDATAGIRIKMDSLLEALQTASLAEPALPETPVNPLFKLGELLLIFLGILYSIIKLIVRTAIFVATLFTIPANSSMLPANAIAGLDLVKNISLTGLGGVSLWTLFSGAMTLVLMFIIVRTARHAVRGG